MRNPSAEREIAYPRIRSMGRLFDTLAFLWRLLRPSLSSPLSLPEQGGVLKSRSQSKSVHLFIVFHNCRHICCCCNKTEREREREERRDIRERKRKESQFCIFFAWKRRSLCLETLLEFLLQWNNIFKRTLRIILSLTKKRKLIEQKNVHKEWMYFLFSVTNSIVRNQGSFFLSVSAFLFIFDARIIRFWQHFCWHETKEDFASVGHNSFLQQNRKEKRETK